MSPNHIEPELAVSLIESVYLIAEDVKSCDQFLKHLVTASGASEMALWCADQGEVTECHTSTSGTLSADELQVILCTELLGGKSNNSEAKSYKGSLHVETMSIITYENSDWYLSFIYERALPTTGMEEVCPIVLPHLKRAIALYERAQKMRIQLGLAQEVVHRLNLAIFLVNKTAVPMLTNRPADRLLSEKDGLYLDLERRLSVNDAEQNITLHQFIGRAVTGKKSSTGRAEGISIKRSGTTSLTLLVTPLNTELGGDLARGSGRAALVFVGENDRNLRLSPAVLSSLFGFTPAEIRVATALVHGKTLDQIADDFKTSKHTLRVQIKALFRKAGVNRQSDLIKMLLTGPCRVFDSL